VTLTVTVAAPVITWIPPASIAYGRALSGRELNATANTPGTFAYSPPAGTVLGVGSQILSVTFTPTDSTDYTTAASSVTLTVTPVATTTTSGGANEYPLQFTPGAGYRGLVVAGYQLVANSFGGSTVLGNCSYYTVRSGSGRGGGYRTITTHYDQTCTWDLYGNLLTVTPGAPVVPAPLSVNGTQTVYAANAQGVFTGSDSALPFHGFVYTPGSHFSWLTPNPYTVLSQTVYTVTATLKSDGDMPLSISSVQSERAPGHRDSQQQHVHWANSRRIDMCRIRNLRSDPSALGHRFGVRHAGHQRDLGRWTSPRLRAELYDRSQPQERRLTTGRLVEKFS